jgi:hypothetical protein
MFDSEGHKTYYLHEVMNDPSENTLRETWTYDATGDMLSDWVEVLVNDQWVNYYRVTYTYDANGNMLSYEEWSNGRNRWTYTYDASGNRLSELNEMWQNGQWVNSIRIMYVYDVLGNLTSVWRHHWLNSSWTPEDWIRKFGDFVLTDSAGNNYEYEGFNFTFTYKTIVTGVTSQSGKEPSTYSLSQNYPNPFNPSTKISWQLPVSSQATLKVYDILGREVATLVNEYRQAGKYETKFNAASLPSGVYFYRIQAGSFVETKKMILLK